MRTIGLSKTKLKLLRQLANKKERSATGLFVAEGTKTVGDIITLQKAELIVATAEWMGANACRINPETELIEASPDELKRLSFMLSPQDVFAVFRQPQCHIDASEASWQLILALDGIQDPGNLGTIVRVADWFGIAHIVCSHGTADIFNPKTVQATMGSIARVGVEYVDLAAFIGNAGATGAAIYGTLLDGLPIYGQPLGSSGVIVMGNEGNGISAGIRPLITVPLRIPSFANGTTGGAESLNVAIATAITCSEFRRR